MGLQEQSSKKKDFVIEIKTFLFSFPPKIWKVEYVKQVIEILKELKAQD